MGAQGTAAALVLRGDDLATLGGQDPDGCGVDLGEKDLLHAPDESPDPPALLAHGGGVLWDLLFLHQLGHEGLHRSHAGGKAAHDAGLAEFFVEAEALVETQRSGGEPQPAAVGEESEDHLPKRLVVGPSLVAALDLSPGGLYELVVLHAGRAGCDTGHTPQAQVPVTDHSIVYRLLGEALVHEVDAPARGVHLLAEKNVGRAGRQAEAAVDTLVYELLVRRVVIVEGREGEAAALGTVLAHGLQDRA